MFIDRCESFSAVGLLLTHPKLYVFHSHLHLFWVHIHNFPLHDIWIQNHACKHMKYTSYIRWMQYTIYYFHLLNAQYILYSMANHTIHVFTKWHSLGAKLNQEIVKEVIQTLAILEGSNLDLFLTYIQWDFFWLSILMMCLGHSYSDGEY